MALQTFLAKTFAAKTFQAATFSSEQLAPLDDFRLMTFRGWTFRAGTFSGAEAPILAPGCIPSDIVTLDTRGDELVWDNTSTVSYASVAKTGDTLYCPVGLHRHAISRKELATSNGVYVPEDTVWRMPRSALPVAPKVRDRLTDAEGVVWTVLEVSRIAATQRFRLVCRDLILVENLRDEIIIQTPSYTFDTVGIRIKTFSVKYADIAARVQPISSEIVDERGIRGLKVTHECIVDRTLEDVTNEDRVSFGGKFYEIRGWSFPERIDELMRLELELMP